jgi:hypothetical protein
MPEPEPVTMATLSRRLFDIRALSLRGSGYLDEAACRIVDAVVAPTDEAVNSGRFRSFDCQRTLRKVSRRSPM